MKTNNKITKRLLGLLLFVACVLVIGYYNRDLPTEPTGINGYNYIFKKKHGKMLVGVETTIGAPKGKMIIAAEYDKITTGFNNSAFIVYQGEDAKVITLNGKFGYRGLSIDPNSIKFLGDKINDGLSFSPGPGYELRTKDGRKIWRFYTKTFEDMDELIPCKNGAVFKKDGKYGYFDYRITVDKTVYPPRVTESDFTITVEAQYDALFEVGEYHSFGQYFLLGRKGNVWTVLDRTGKPTKRYPSIINRKLSELPIKTKIRTDAFRSRMLDKVTRMGERDAGMFVLSMDPIFWNPYFE